MIHKFTLLEKLLLRFNVIPHPVLDALTYIVAGRGLQVGVRLGIFEELSKGPISIRELVRNTKTNLGGMSQLVDVLDALGYVKKEKDNQISLTKRGKKFFSVESESSMKNTVLFSDYVYNSLGNLEENVKTGGPKDVNLDVFTPKQWDIFNNTMIEIAKSNSTEIAGLIPLSKKHKKLLDIGGSHGLHAIEICKKLPGLSAKVLDLKPVEDFANKTIKKYKMSDRVKFKAGDFHKDDIGEGYDIILAFNIIHGLNPETNKKLTNKIYKSLNRGGIYVILDQIKEASGKSELSRLVSSSQGLMLFNVTGGRAYSFGEVKEWLDESGFVKPRMKKLRAPGNAVIIGYK